MQDHSNSEIVSDIRRHLRNGKFIEAIALYDVLFERIGVIPGHVIDYLDACAKAGLFSKALDAITAFNPSDLDGNHKAVFIEIFSKDQMSPFRDRLDHAAKKLGIDMSSLESKDDRFASLRIASQSLAASPETLQLTDIGIDVQMHARLLQDIRELPAPPELQLAKQMKLDALAYTLVPEQSRWQRFVGRQSSSDAQARTAINKKEVPRIIHQIWIGNRAPPEHTFNAWRAYAKSNAYEYRLWTDNDIGALNLTSLWAFNELHRRSEWAACADLMRYAILYKFGGIYIDADFYPLSVRPLHDHIIDRGLSLILEGTPRRNFLSGGVLYTNSFIATPEKNGVFEIMLEKMDEGLKLFPHAPAWWLPGPYYISSMTYGYVNSLGDDFTCKSVCSFDPDEKLFESGIQQVRQDNPNSVLVTRKTW